MSELERTDFFDDEIGVVDPALFARVSKDLLKMATTLDARSAAMLVGYYYDIQKFRIAAAARAREAAQGKENPHEFFLWVTGCMNAIETGLTKQLGAFARIYSAGRWMQSICGIGPIMSAGFLTYVDIRQAPHVGHFWSYAGLNPDVEWLGRERAKKVVDEIAGKATVIPEATFHDVCDAIKRRPENIRKMIEGDQIKRDALVKAISKPPWNTKLKTLVCGRLAPCFVKVQGREKDFYGAWYKRYKNFLIERNDAREFSDCADKRKEEVGKSTEAWKHYNDGRLPPGHIDRRAMRWVGKLFLSHFHELLSIDYYGKAPEPYILAKGHDSRFHKHKIEPPNRGEYAGGKPIRELFGE